ncbi:hypothetical protein SAM19_03459 [Brevibacillus laterosporus]|nr:hypothetical protein [Brevibacillus laterosporus]
MLLFCLFYATLFLQLMILGDRMVVTKAVSTSNHFRLTPYL